MKDLTAKTDSVWKSAKESLSAKFNKTITVLTVRDIALILIFFILGICAGIALK